MRKLHWLKGDKTMCRQESGDLLKRDPAEKITQVTCVPCLKALGLSKVVFKASFQRARITINLPNGKKPVCLATDFEMKIDNARALEEPADGDYVKWIGQEPEPISFKMTLTEDGWNSLKESILGK